MNSGNNHIGRKISRFENLADWCAWLVVFGLVLEVALAAGISDSPVVNKWGVVGSDILVALGVAGEILFSRKARSLSERLRQESEEKIADANLKRAELEASIQPRMTDQRQFDVIQTLRGKVPEVSLIHETDAEPRWFADSLRGAFFNADLRVGMYPRAADVHSTGILIYDPGMHGAKSSEVGDTLIDIFRGTGTALAMITGLPTDVPDAPAEYPAILVGGRFPVLPPHIAKATQAADAIQTRMRRKP
jgi:hypothetical protein